MRVVISAGEPSGEVLAGLLESELSLSVPSCDVHRLQDRVPVTPVLGFGAGLTAAVRMRKTLGAAERAVIELLPDVIVLIAYSGWHLPLGRRLRRRGLRVVFLSPPQVWAWGAWRIRALERAADQVVCLFRFEQALLRQSGIDAEYFGYPLLDSVAAARHRHVVSVRSDRGLSLVVLPGSRPSEYNYHGPLFQTAGAELRREFPELVVADLRTIVRHVTGSAVGPEPESRYQVMASADCALAVSGTVTAELAILGVPMVVCYHLPTVERLLARAVIRTQWFALPNIVARRSIVPELLNPSPAVLAVAVADVLGSDARRRQMRSDLELVERELGPAGAMAAIARLVRATAHRSPQSA
jgi:lipid-A-disaccharide synthase